jgi:hypothetical protein
MVSRLLHKKYRAISEAVALIAGIGVAIASIAIVFAYMQSQGQILQRNIDVKYENLTLMLAPSDLADCGVHRIQITGKITNTGNVELQRVGILFRNRGNNDILWWDTWDVRPSDSRQVGWYGDVNNCLRAGEVNPCFVLGWRRDSPNIWDVNVADIRVPCKYRVVQ